MFKCAKALHYAHSRGVIHRDIKPSNIMLTPDSDVRIIDFGIALVAGSDISRIEGIAGSPSYMSPEQVQSLELTHQSDLYSLGAVMYELLTGVRPFRAGNLAKLLHQIVYATPAPIHTLRSDVSEEIENVVGVAMQKDPARRYRSGLDLAAELTRVHQKLRQQYSRMDQQEQFSLLRRLKFFHDFSHAEIHEVMRASHWQDYASGEEIVKEGEMDDRFYILVSDTAPWSDTVRRWHAAGGRMLRRGQLRTRRQAHGHHSRGGYRNRPEGQLDAARAGFGLVSAAFQPGFPASTHRPPAGPGPLPGSFRGSFPGARSALTARMHRPTGLHGPVGLFPLARAAIRSVRWVLLVMSVAGRPGAAAAMLMGTQLR